MSIQKDSVGNPSKESCLIKVCVQMGKVIKGGGGLVDELGKMDCTTWRGERNCYSGEGFLDRDYRQTVCQHRLLSIFGQPLHRRPVSTQGQVVNDGITGAKK